MPETTEITLLLNLRLSAPPTDADRYTLLNDLAYAISDFADGGMILSRGFDDPAGLKLKSVRLLDPGLPAPSNEKNWNRE